MKLRTRMFLVVLLVIGGMTGLVVLVGGGFVGQEVLRKTVVALARTQSSVGRFTDELHQSLEQANALISELPTAKAAAAEGDFPTVAQQVAEVAGHTGAQLFAWIRPRQVVREPDGRGGWRDRELARTQLGVLLDGRTSPPVAHVAEAPREEAGGLFDFEDPGAPMAAEVGGRDPTLPGTEWLARELPPELEESPLVAYLRARSEAIQDTWRAGGSTGSPRGEKLTATFRGRLLLVAYRAFHQREDYLGVLASAVEVGDRLAERIASAAGSQVTFMRLPASGRAEVLGSSLAMLEGGAGAARMQAYATMVTSGELVPGTDPRPVTLAGRRYVVQAVLLTTLQGTDRAVVVIEGDLTAGLGTLLEDLRGSLLAVSVVVALLALVLLSVAIRAWVTGPVEELIHGMERIREGRLDVPITVVRGDEMGDLAGSYNEMLVELRKKEQYMRMVSRSAVDAVESRVTANLAEGGERRVVTMLFSDIRSFTTLCERIDPSALVQLLNRYFDAMVEIIYRHGGILDKFIGDAIMAAFEHEGHPESAVLAALEMQEEVARLDAEEQLGLRIGVGLHTGEVIAGFVGAKEFMNHTYLGDAVNVAARLESESKNGRHTHVILSQGTLDAVPGLVQVEKLAKESVKGKTQSVVMYEVVRLEDRAAVLEGLASQDAEERARSARVAGKLGGPEVVARLLELAGDRSSPVALAAITSLSGRAVRELVLDVEARSRLADRLLERLGSEERAEVRAALVTALGSLGGLDVLTRLTPWLADPEPRVRASTVEALQRLGSAAVGDAVRPLLADGASRVRANAALCLFEQSPEVVTDALVEGLASQDPGVRASSCYAVWSLAGRQPAELLDPERARDLDARGHRVHTCFRRLAGQLSALVARERDDAVLGNLAPALRILLGSEVARPMLDAALRRRREERGDGAGEEAGSAPWGAFRPMADAD